jgi:hypothetical protein
MAQTLKLKKATVKRGNHLSTGKGWRLLRKNETRGFKASLLKTLRISGERLAIFRIVE